MSRLNMSPIDYSVLGIPKGTPRCVTKRQQEKEDARDERTARAKTRKRDKGKCRIPGCKEHAAHLHHVVYRSKSRGLRWRTENLAWVCVDHHRLLHAHVIELSGNADEELIVTGDVDRLRFRL